MLTQVGESAVHPAGVQQFYLQVQPGLAVGAWGPLGPGEELRFQRIQEAFS